MTMKSEKNRFCFCPAQVRANCTCSRCNCLCFNGFKRLRVIMASAGTGKTFQLAMRFIQLLCFGVDPSEILAVTFTKKAAGEIFDKIIGRLLELADASGKSEPCNICENFSRAQFLDILHRLLEMRRELQIGTIDSFFRKLTDVYAPELGIWGGISLIDAKDRSYRRRTLRKWLRQIGGGAELSALRELLKMANRDEQKSFSATMDELVDCCYPFFLSHETDHLIWGKVPFLFGGDQEELPQDAVTELAGRLDAAMEVFKESEEKCDAVAVRRLQELAKFCASGAETIGRLPDDVKSLFQNLAKYNLPGWEKDSGKDLLVARKWGLTGNIGNLVRQLFCHIRAILMRQSRKRSNAVYQLMASYDRIYHREVRAAGLLTFADIPYLLQSGGGEAGFQLFANDSVNLEERLDARLNHYLFDEFQDTSDIQWNAFDNLLDELVNDRESDFRTFFCVGDIKQSIYRFRQGNPRLFDRVIGKMKTEADTLTLSRRSAPQVMELVNRVFVSPEGGRGFLHALPRLKFEKHEAYHQDMPGFAALIQFEKADRSDRCEKAKADFILSVLCDVRPFDKNLSVGILMRNNRHLREFAQVLQESIRERALPFTVSVDGTLSVLESTAVEIFLQLLTLASHPADRSARTFLHLAQWGNEALSWEQWGKCLHLGNIGDADALSQALRHIINADGIIELADRFQASFGSSFGDFDRKRFDALRKMANSFSGAIDDFREQLQWQEDEEKSLAGTIQLMTIHKSKGLEFDLVFLPEFDSRHRNVSLVPETDIPDVRQIDAKRRWIGYLPDESVASSLPDAAAYFAAREKEEQYDDCCTVYVALTRAKRGLYLLFATPGKNSQQPEAALVEALATDDMAAHRAKHDFAERLPLPDPACYNVRYAAGQSDFYTAIPDREETLSLVVARDPEKISVVSRRLDFARPSAAHGVRVFSENCFEPAHGAETGTLIHALFEKIDFIGEDFDAGIFLAGNFAGGDGEAGNLFISSLASPEIRNALKRPAPDVILWREKNFLHHTATGVVSGTFDRVVLIRENGKIVRAEILDYKSDRLTAPEDFLARHAAQLEIYRAALAAMTHLEPCRIACTLLALRLGKAVSVPLAR